MVDVTPRTEGIFIQLTEIFRGRIVDVAAESMIIEIAGQEGKIEAFIEMMRPLGIVELVRTGRIAMVRGKADAENNGQACEPAQAGYGQK